jgi:polyisoprenoid-binding protein YceI
VTLDVTLNGAYASLPIDHYGSRIGFSAHGTLKRSAFGVSTALVQPGNRIGIGDDVEVIIEAEFTRPTDHH